MSQEASSSAPESDVTSVGFPLPPSPSRSSGNISSSDDDSLWDAMEEEIEAELGAELEAQLLRDASLAQRPQVAAQLEELRRQAARSKEEARRMREETRRMREYSDLLDVDVSEFTDAQMAAYERELDRRSEQILRRRD